jgi:hypothetical protein
MDTITVNRSKPTEVEFDMRIDGASIDEADAKFVIHCDEFDIRFDCKHTSQYTFAAQIPAITFLQKGVHDCSVEVVVNGQLFKPLKGNATIVDNIKVEVSTEKPKDKSEEAEEIKQVPPFDREPKSSLSPFALANYLQNRDVADEHEEVSENVKDKKVREILKEMQIVPIKKPRTKPRSLKNITESKRLAK